MYIAVANSYQFLDVVDVYFIFSYSPECDRDIDFFEDANIGFVDIVVFFACSQV